MSIRRIGIVVLALASNAIASQAGAAPLGTGFTFQGQLQDNNMPRNGLCDFQFRLFDAADRGNQIGGADIVQNVLVQNGVFTVLVNSDSDFGPTAFNGDNRWLQVAVRCPAGNGNFSAAFSPRQAIMAVPYALHVSSGLTGLVDNGDGTVTDHSTGLMWEKKTGTYNEGAFINCGTTTCSDPRNVNNIYDWCEDRSPDDSACDNPGPYSDNPPDGGAFYDFLARTNGELCGSPTCTGLAGYTDWRIPTLAELRTIVPSPCPAGEVPCVDPVFGPTARNSYWSSTTRANIPGLAWSVFFATGSALESFKDDFDYVRAVRGGL